MSICGQAKFVFPYHVLNRSPQIYDATPTVLSRWQTNDKYREIRPSCFPGHRAQFVQFAFFLGSGTVRSKTVAVIGVRSYRRRVRIIVMGHVNPVGGTVVHDRDVEVLSSDPLIITTWFFASCLRSSCVHSQQQRSSLVKLVWVTYQLSLSSFRSR